MLNLFLHTPFQAYTLVRDECNFPKWSGVLYGVQASEPQQVRVHRLRDCG